MLVSISQSLQPSSFSKEESIKKFDKALGRHTFKTTECAHFHTNRQEQGESLIGFASNLTEKVTSCAFLNGTLDRLLIAVLVAGINKAFARRPKISKRSKKLCI